MTYEPWCEGKTPYPSKAQAMARVQHQKGNRRRKRGKGEQCRILMPYRCTVCHQWHVGAAYRDMNINQFGQPVKRRRNGNPERPAP